jgi:hypothetical protein
LSWVLAVNTFAAITNKNFGVADSCDTFQAAIYEAESLGEAEAKKDRIYCPTFFYIQLPITHYPKILSINISCLIILYHLF